MCQSSIIQAVYTDVGTISLKLSTATLDTDPIFTSFKSDFSQLPEEKKKYILYISRNRQLVFDIPFVTNEIHHLKLLK